MRMGNKSGRPQKWEWVLSIGLLLSGLLMLLPVFPDVLRTRLPQVLLPSGLILLVITVLQYFYFRSLPPEEQGERDRDGRDERSVMLRGKIAYVLLIAETIFLFILLMMVGYLQERRDVFQCIVWIILFRTFAILPIRWWLNRKY